MGATSQPSRGGLPRASRIVIADDFEMLRRGLRSLLGPVVCGEAENGQQAVQKVMELRPDLVILDWSMPVMNGLEAAKAIRGLMPRVKILVFSLHDMALIRNQALAAGADAVLHKTAKSEEILEMIERLVAPLGASSQSSGERSGQRVLARDLPSRRRPAAERRAPQPFESREE